MKFKKAISLLLTLVLLFEMLPLQVFALDGADAPPTAVSTVAEAVIEGELHERREENVKHFRLSDGSFLAVDYGTAVHYEDNGVWKDIDNRLEKQGGTASGDNAVQSAPVGSQSEAVWTNRAGELQISLPDKLKDGSLVRIGRKSYELSFAPVVERSSGSHMTTTQMGVTAQVQEVSESAEPTRAGIHNTGAVVYPDVTPGVDYRYDLVGSKLKETIILRDKASAPTAFSFLVTAPGLSLVETEDEYGFTGVSLTAEGETIFHLPDPFAFDAEGCTVPVEAQWQALDNQVYLLRYTVDEEWLRSEERVWPVYVDPVTCAKSSRGDVYDSYVRQGYPYQGYLGANYMYAGYFSGATKEVQAYVLFDNLPTLRSGDVIVNAELQLRGSLSTAEGLSGQSIQVNAHRVSKKWNPRTMCWYNKADFDSKILDLQFIDSTLERYSWDVTDAVQDWYAKDYNYGIMLESPSGDGSDGSKYHAKFNAVDGTSSSSGAWPTLTINYRNTTGLESYWDTSAYSAGRAGTVYVNNATGAETVLRSDMGFGGSRMPVSIDFAHNQTAAETDIGYGKGWRPAYAQTLQYVPAAASGLPDYYRWTDSDGTELFFQQIDSGWKDEDGRGYTLTLGDAPTISDRDNNKLIFDSALRLVRMEDGKIAGNAIRISYTDTTSSRIEKVIDGAGRVYAFSYANDLLSRIDYMGSGETALFTVSYAYDASGQLTAVTYPDGENIAYAYADNRLQSLSDIDRGENIRDTVSLAYNPDKRQVTSLTYTDAGTLVSSLSFTYGDHWTKVADNLGHWCTYQFNNFNNTTSVYNEQGQALYGSFATDTDADAPRNRLLTSSRMQDSTINLLGDFQRSITETTPAVHHVPAGLYNISGTLSADGCITVSCVPQSDPNGPAQIFTSPSGKAGDRVELTLTPGVNSSFTISGSATEMQMETSLTSSRYNMLAEVDMNNISGLWQGSGGEQISDTTPRARLNLYALKLPGSPTETRKYTQTIPFAGSSSDKFTFGLWVKSESVSLDNRSRPDRLDENGNTTQAPLRRCGVEVLLKNGAETVGEAYVAANPACPEWQFLSGSVQTTQAGSSFTSIEFSAVYDYNANSAYFDGAQLFHEGFADHYTYDDAGRISSVTEADGHTTFYAYRDTSSDITKITLPGSTAENPIEYSYTYDETTKLLTGTHSATGIKTSHSYDSYGNMTETTIRPASNDSAAPIQSNNSFTADGNLPASVTAGDRNTVSQNYDTQRSLLNSTTDPLGTETAYTYDGMGRLTQTSAGGSSVSYAYADDRLQSITHSGQNSTTYAFTYGTAGLTESVRVGDNTLVTNGYDGRFNLASQTYGNGQSVSYSYDSADRLTSATEGDTNYQYYYNNKGELGRIEKRINSVLTEQESYTYDSDGRLLSLTGHDAGGAILYHYLWRYNAEDNVTSQTSTVNGVTETVNFTYNADQMPTAVSGALPFTLAYDGYGRINSLSGSVLTQSYGYRSVTNDQGTFATTKIETLTNTYGNANHTLNYTYDANGNILSVSDGTNTTTYTYDALGQLIQENNGAAGKSWNYTYDSGGNILSKTEQDSTGNTLSTVSYGYDTTWGDLLTSYNGSPVSSDAIGNITAYNGKTLTYQAGRQLASITANGVTSSYIYNEAGLRTSKTVGTDATTYTYKQGQLAGVQTSQYRLNFHVDPNGQIAGFTCRMADGAQMDYTYVKNQQGDILAVIDPAGAEAATYTYDAWGRILSVGGYDAGLAERNPLRYRGYIYDSETGFYYVSSRYYDPEIGRFINADAAIGQIGNIQSYNMFAYCFNNPLNMSDPTGNWPKLSTIFAAVAVAAVVVAAVAVTVATCGAAAPAMAAVGGGVVGGISAGLATTVAAGAMALAGVSAAAALTVATVEKSNERKNRKNNTVYRLVDSCRQTQYVGRTTNVDARKNAHKQNPDRANLQFEVIASDLNYYEARGLEQLAMLECHTINTANRMNNQINGISPSNKSLGIYMEAGRGVAGYLGNQISNDILYWTGN